MKLKKAPSRNQLVAEATDAVHSAFLSISNLNSQRPDVLARHAMRKLDLALHNLSSEARDAIRKMGQEEVLSGE